MGFSAAAMVFRNLTPARHSYVEQKLGRVIQASEPFDVLFLGSSHINSGFDPAAFDAEMAAAGFPTHSYNFGVAAMTPPMIGQILERILESDAPLPRTLFLEFHWNLGSAEDASQVPATEYFISWHDATATLAALAAQLLTFDQPWYRMQRAGVHLSAFAAQLTAFHQGRKWWRHRGPAPLRPNEVVSEKIAMADGYFKRNSFLRDREKYSSLLSAFEAERAQPQPWNAGDYARALCHEAVVREARAHGIEVVTVIFPILEPLGPAVLDTLSEPVFRFDDPQQYPNLYGADYRWNTGHFNVTGAAHFSRLLARQLLEWRSRDLH